MATVHPYHVRRAALRLICDGTPVLKAAERHGVSSYSIHRWCKMCGVTEGCEFSEDELDAKMEVWAEEFRNMPLPEDATNQQKKLKEFKDRRKFGNPIEERMQALSMLKNMKDPDVYLAAISEQFENVAAQMDRATSVQDQMTAMWAGWLLVQMRELLETKINLGSISDVEKLFGMFRKTFHMDQDKGGKNEGPDLALLTAKVGARTVIEVTDQPKKRGRRKILRD